MSTAATRRAILLAACLIGLVAWPGLSRAEVITFKVPLSGAQEVPPVEAAGTGMADITYDPATHVLTWSVTYSGLTGPATMAHLHIGPATQGGKTPYITWFSKQGSPADSPITGQTTLTPEQAQQLLSGGTYVNVHTQANPGGEIRGQVTAPKS